MPDKPGVMLRTEPMATQPELTHASSMLRMLYTSTDARWNSGVLPVSGTLYLPNGTMPVGGWPVVAWAHGTLGVADACAPSWQLHRPRDAHYMNRWLAQGFAVVATDYQGLGGPGPHPYLFWEAEGRSVLDSVRAAIAANPGRLANRLIITGQSQGSGASLGASRIAPDYAPELGLVATIATGVATSFPQGPYQMQPVWKLGQQIPPRFTMLRLVGGAIPDGGVAPESLVSQKSAALLESARGSCIDEMRSLEREQGITSANAFTMPQVELDALLTSSTDMTPARLPAPLFLGTGLADRTIVPQHQYAAAVALCAAGNPLTWRAYPGASHNGIVNAAFDDELAFVRQVMAGHAPAGNCDRLAEPGAPEAVTPGILYND